VLRVKPQLSRLSAAQVLGLCAAAIDHGAGLIDLTNRANLQLRGVAPERLQALQDRLGQLGLLDATPELESRRNILVAPFWQEGDDTHRIARDLTARLDRLPDLPSKFGFAIDAGKGVMLRNDPADIRIERAASGGLILRTEGRDLGAPVERGTEADAAIALACWFIETGGTFSGRMARHDATLPAWASGTEPPASPAQPPEPGDHPRGPIRGLPFGQARAADLARLVEQSGAAALRLTPWRLVVIEGGRHADVPGFVDRPGSPLLRADACAGAPFCPQASVETRALAERLAPLVEGRLHVSGCAKGCANPRPTPITLTGRDGRYDLALAARPGDKPVRAGLGADDVLAHFGAA
jgi:precorrin-3B synthase